MGTPRPSTTPPAEAEGMQAARTVWRLLCHAYGGRFSSQYGRAPNRTNPAFVQWHQALCHLPEAAVVAACRRWIGAGNPWPPNLAELIGRCQPRPEDVGLPSVERALDLGLGRAQGHPATRHPAVRMARYHTHRRAESTIGDRERVFRAVYRWIVRQTMAGQATDTELPAALATYCGPVRRPGSRRETATDEPAGTPGPNRPGTARKIPHHVWTKIITHKDVTHDFKRSDQYPEDPCGAGQIPAAHAARRCRV